MINKLPKIEEITWDDIRDRVKTINQDLFNSIESISPSKDLTLYRVRYNFGDPIVQQGLLCLPSENEKFIPLTKMEGKILEDLSYSPIPMGLILKNSTEVFVTHNDRIIPMHYAKAGYLIGVFEALDYITDTKTTPLWDLTAGIRSIFMLPHITQEKGIKRLMKAFRLPHNLQIKNLSDQWQLFKLILKEEEMKDPWCCEMIFFSKKWFEFRHDESWSLFNRQIVKYGWGRIQFTFNQIERAVIWQEIIEVVEKRNLKPRHYIADTVKHLFAIASSRYPGFVPIDHEPEAAPITTLQDIFREVYGLENYFPTFMGPRALDQLDNLPVYYSLNLPTLIEGIPPLAKKSNRLMVDLREIKLIIDTFMERSTYLNEHPKLQNVKFDYYHAEKDIYEKIKLSKDIPETDERFVYPQESFCQFSPFWRGCIKIDNHH